MKPRTAVATYLLATISNAMANTSALHAHAQRHKIRSHKPITTKQAARLQAIGAFYADQIAQTLAAAQFEGDTAELPGVTNNATTNGSFDGADVGVAGDCGSTQYFGDTAEDPEPQGDTGPNLDMVVRHVLGGPSAPELHITINGDVHINR